MYVLYVLEAYYLYVIQNEKDEALMPILSKIKLRKVLRFQLI